MVLKSTPRLSFRRATFLNAHARLKLFTGRTDPAGREEQFEKFYILLMDASPTAVDVRAFEVGDPVNSIPLDRIVDDLLMLVAERNPDFYELENGNPRAVRG